jgi:HAMP domain-containing protein
MVLDHDQAVWLVAAISERLHVRRAVRAGDPARRRLARYGFK